MGFHKIFLHFELTIESLQKQQQIYFHPWVYSELYIDGLMQERRNSSALAMDLRLSCLIQSK